MPRTLYLAAYDVADPARLRRALRLVRSQSTGGQKSAFECWLTGDECQRMAAEARELLDADEDRFALIPLDIRRPALTLGIASTPADPAFFYFG